MTSQSTLIEPASPPASTAQKSDQEIVREAYMELLNEHPSKEPTWAEISARTKKSYSTIGPLIRAIRAERLKATAKEAQIDVPDIAREHGQKLAETLFAVSYKLASDKVATQIASLTSQLEQQLAEQSVLDDLRSAAELRAIEADSKAQAAYANAAESSRRLEEARAQLNQALQENTTVASRSADQSARIQALTSELADARRRLEECEHKLAQTTRDLLTSVEELATARGDHRQALARTQALDKEISQLKADVDQLRLSLSGEQAKTLATQEALNDEIHRHQRVADLLDTTKRQLASATAELDSERKARAADLKRLDAVSAELKDLTLQVKNLAPKAKPGSASKSSNESQ